MLAALLLVVPIVAINPGIAINGAGSVGAIGGFFVVVDGKIGVLVLVIGLATFV